MQQPGRASICEKLIKKRWVKFLERNMIVEKQYGIRQGHSRIIHLSSFYSRLTDLTQERDGGAECVYLDLKKVFDKVPRVRPTLEA